jgi:dTDP-4-dehydrorhamnose reductase/UDP-glucose 4-epimerase
MTAVAEVLVVGRGSFLAQAFVASDPPFAVRAIGHAEAGEAKHYAGIAAVVNFAFAPSLHDSPYRPELDVDERASRRAAQAGAHYVMISSRRVYSADAAWNARESASAEGIDEYGRNKLRIEHSLADRLGERLTILRPGNVVGYEPVPGRRRFAAYLQNQLRETGRIRLTVHPRTRRDLVPLEFFCRVVSEVLLRRAAGVFNVGAGEATEVGQAARWLIEGYGAGEIIVESSRVEDEFQLDSSALQRAFGLSCDPQGVERTLRDAGRRMALEARRRA